MVLQCVCSVYAGGKPQERENEEVKADGEVPFSTDSQMTIPGTDEEAQRMASEALRELREMELQTPQERVIPPRSPPYQSHPISASLSAETLILGHEQEGDSDVDMSPSARNEGGGNPPPFAVAKAVAAKAKAAPKKNPKQQKEKKEKSKEKETKEKQEKKKKAADKENQKPAEPTKRKLVLEDLEDTGEKVEKEKNNKAADKENQKPAKPTKRKLVLEERGEDKNDDVKPKKGKKDDVQAKTTAAKAKAAAQPSKVVRRAKNTNEERTAAKAVPQSLEVKPVEVKPVEVEVPSTPEAPLRAEVNDSGHSSLHRACTSSSLTSLLIRGHSELLETPAPAENRGGSTFLDEFEDAYKPEDDAAGKDEMKRKKRDEAQKLQHNRRMRFYRSLDSPKSPEEVRKLAGRARHGSRTSIGLMDRE